MKRDIILAGVGGQGILTIAASIGLAAINSGLHLKQAEVHGMSQRGGAVQSHLRISSEPVYSDLIPQGKADMIVAVEPMESLRYINMLTPDGWLITNIHPHVNINDYPELEIILDEIRSFKNHIALDAEKIAKEISTARAANIVMLGASLPFLGLEISQVEKALFTLFGRKGEEVVQSNLKALHTGKEIAEKNFVKS